MARLVVFAYRSAPFDVWLYRVFENDPGPWIKWNKVVEWRSRG